MKTNIGWQDSPNVFKLKLLDEFLLPKKNLNVLELAAGYGWYSKYLHNKGHRVTSVDIEPHFEQEGINVILADLEKPIGFKNDSFDVVVVWDIIEHINNESQILNEIQRVSRENALIFISVPHVDDSRIASSYLTYSHFKDKTHKREYTPEELAYKFESIGFKKLKLQLEGGGSYPYIILNFIDNVFFKYCMKLFIRGLIFLGILKLKNCHGDIFAVFKK
ncbi:MAG TPA: class I SAM-dependent methyltransferase [Ohtaekwangia sp.]|uniref:class I SAM-dependent methyltransferase n=1 Tax=Ohtaekwangia sp. TaxID=2066019 RepID=UPI002F9441B5